MLQDERSIPWHYDFFSFTYKVPFESHPEIGISVAQLNLKVVSKTTHSLLFN
mgnify:FL=1